MTPGRLLDGRLWSSAENETAVARNASGNCPTRRSSRTPKPAGSGTSVKLLPLSEGHLVSVNGADQVLDHSQIIL